MNEISAICVWIAMAILCWAVAKNKGRDEWIAFAVGLLFGIFALIYYLVARGSIDYEKKKLAKREKMIK